MNAATPAAAGALPAPWRLIDGGVTAPQGFRAAGITAGLKPSGNPDLSLLLAPEGAVCAGTFTTSLVRAACVDLCTERLRASGGHARAVLTNSGQANACTGERGLADSLTATAELAQRLGLDPSEVLICSTGVIGVPIPMDTLIAGLDPLLEALSETGGDAAAKAILTTDLIVSRLGDVLGRCGCPVFDLSSHTEGLSRDLRLALLEDAQQYGLEIPSLLIEGLTLPPEVEAALVRRSVRLVEGDPGQAPARPRRAPPPPPPLLFVRKTQTDPPAATTEGP